ncbi:MAG TPA: hypothetical protein DHU26_07200 [Spirochaetaceae bacterium]|nr:hypothetical protein [Spirochaetaceae bacterium]
MNMLKEEKNSLYRLTIKNTQEFDRDILKRFVNFMSNPDEETAVAQFGKGDKYFGVATMLATMPGLPMIAHGQIEGFTEKYGMEFKRSYKDETPDRDFIARHEREIFPLLRTRPLFSDIEHFFLYDYMRADGTIDENVFAYTNGQGEQRALILYNNCWERTSGRIHNSCAFTQKSPSGKKHLETITLAKALGVEPSPDNYLIMHEIRSGLWFIYRSEEIASSGLQVALEGYQSKVFLEISSVHDTEGRYARLYEIVDSKGIADLDDALLEADQPDLFRALHNAIVSLNGVEAVESLSKSEAIARAAIFSEMFFSRLCATAGCEYTHPASRAESIRRAVSWMSSVLSGLYNPEILDEAPLAAYRIGAPRKRLTLLVYAFISALAKSFAADGLSEDIGRVVEEYRITKKLREFAVALSRTIPDEPENSIDPSAEAEIAIAWALRADAKLFAASAVSNSGKKESAVGASPSAHDILEWAFSNALMRAALGVNHYRGTEYFNRERFEAFIGLLPAFGWIDSITQIFPEGDVDAVEFWHLRAELLAAHEADSGYLTKTLLENVLAHASP